MENAWRILLSDIVPRCGTSLDLGRGAGWYLCGVINNGLIYYKLLNLLNYGKISYFLGGTETKS